LTPERGRDRLSGARTASPEARAHHARVVAALGDTLATLPVTERHLFEARLARRFEDLFDGLEPVYGQRPDFAGFLERLVTTLARGWVVRPDASKALDMERDLAPDWFQHESMLGYVFYVERFAGSLAGVHEHFDYLDEIGATYVHLMKVMHARDGENDGGYAIVDYRSVDPSIGSDADLERLCTALRERGTSVCVDLVLNHCAREHPWAEAARDGDAHYLDYFHTFTDRTRPDAYERTLPEVFPDFAPGNFTHDERMGRWVWTTFNTWQWDLNWSNPEVFLEIVEVMLALANLGVEVFRLDAVAFMWKRVGTDSQNQEEVYDLLQALRACSRIATPAVVHKAEAIVSPDDLIRYFGIGRRHGKVSNVAYHNSLMVQFWSALASRDTRLMTRALGEFPKTPNNIAWGTYIRCHDDIGWAIADDDATAAGLDPFAHRSFLSDYYTGNFAASFARGGVFQHNPATDDRRVNGTFASLAGLELARESGDGQAVDLAIERILLGHALIAGFGGIPLIYMGDEIGLANDPSWADDPEHASDSRWLHRPAMDWAAAARRNDPSSIEGRLFAGLVHIVRARRATPQLHAAHDTAVLDTGHPHVFAHARRHPLGPFVALYNLTEGAQWLRRDVLRAERIEQPLDRLGGGPRLTADDHVELPPYGRVWLTG